MIAHFTTKRDLITAFGNAMNLVSPEVENHHEKVAYIACRLAEIMGMSDRQRQLVVYGALLHDIGGVLQQGRVSIAEVERNAKAVAKTGSAILRSFPLTLPLHEIVAESQTPWRVLHLVPDKLRSTQQMGQIIHIADVASLFLDGKEPVLNQVARVRACVLRDGNNEFSPQVVAAFDTLCSREAVWMDILYRPQLFLDLIGDNRDISLDETVKLTEFMSHIIDFRSPFTAMHSAGVSATATALAEKIGMSEDECKQMRIAGYLHDIGKLRVPNAILEKPGKLTTEEFNVMKEHPYYTWLILRDITGFEQITAWAAYHHEKLNGNGYPFHYSQDELSLGSRIMTVADIFAALTEQRPYRKTSMGKEKVTELLRGDVEKGLLSGSIVELLLSNFEEINALRDVESRAASKKYQDSLERG